MVKMGQSSTVIDTTASVVEENNVISLAKANETRQSYDVVPAREKYKQEILASGEVDRLTSTIALNDTASILEFGKEPAGEIAKVADQVMAKYNSTCVQETSKLVDSLLNVMKKIDIKEIQNAKELMATREKKSFFDRFKQSAQEKLDALVGKYKTLGSDMEKICIELSNYEQQIKSSNKDIEQMYEVAMHTFKKLTAYILAGDQAVKEIMEYRDEKQKEFESTGDTNLQFEVQNINQALTLMEQRVADLRGAEAVALQSIPTFKVQEHTNACLARKINSAFIVTVPAFKSALVNSVIAKQQAIQMQGLAALDEATSMLIRSNAENVVSQLHQSQKLANSSAIKADDIEYAWNTIMDGIKQYREMEKEYREVRKVEAQRIEAANNRYLQSVADGSSI